MSPKWIDSLFNSGTSFLSPLDFRLTAAAQFRLLQAIYSGAAAGVDYFRNSSLQDSLISSKTISRQSLSSQADAVIKTFNALVRTASLTNSSIEFIMMVVRNTRITSAVYTNIFHLSMPESDQYEIIHNFYPRYDNASYNNVSSLRI